MFVIIGALFGVVVAASRIRPKRRGDYLLPLCQGVSPFAATTAAPPPCCCSCYTCMSNGFLTSTSRLSLETHCSRRALRVVGIKSPASDRALKKEKVGRDIARGGIAAKLLQINLLLRAAVHRENISIDRRLIVFGFNLSEDFLDARRLRGRAPLFKREVGGWSSRSVYVVLVRAAVGLPVNANEFDVIT